MNDQPDAPDCTDPCDRPEHFTRHLAETCERVIALGHLPADPRAVVRLSSQAADTIRTTTPVRDTGHLRGHSVIGAVTDEFARLQARTDTRVPEGIALVVGRDHPLWRPPAEVHDSGAPRASLDVDPT